MPKEIKYYGQLRPTGVDDSAARRLQAIAGVADQVQDIAYQAGARMAQREGEREGLTAGQAAAVEGQPLEKREGILSAFSIKDNSYNDALESAYLSQVSVDSQEQMARIAAQYPDDVEAYSKAAAEVRKGITSSIDPNYQGVVGATLDNVIQSYETKVFANQAARGRALADESRLSNIETLGRNAASFARNGDTEQAAFTLLEAKTVLDSMARQKGESWVTEQYRLLVREVKEQEIKHGLANKLETEGRDAAFTSLRELENTGEFTADEFDALKSGAKAMLERDVSIQEASRQVASDEELEDFNAYIDFVKIGGEPSAEETARIGGYAAQDPKLQERFNLARSLSAFSVMPAFNRAEEIAKAESEASKDVGNLPYFAEMVAANEAINEAARKDPLALANSQGLIPGGLDPIDVTNPQTWTAETLSLRMKQAKNMTQHYGVPVPPLTDGEISELAAGIPELSPIEKVSLARMIAPAIDNDRDPRAQLPGLLSEKNQQVFAQVAAMGNFNDQIAVFVGQERLDAGNLLKDLTLDQYSDIFEGYVADVYETEDKSSTLQAALAHYAGTAPPSRELNRAYFRKSMRAVAGNIDEINGFPTVIPPAAQNASQFQNFIDNIDAEYIESIGGSSNITPSDLVRQIKNVRIKNIGANKFIFALTKEELEGTTALQTVVKPDGKPLELSYKTEDAAMLNYAGQAKRKQKAERLIPQLLQGYFLPPMSVGEDE